MFDGLLIDIAGAGKNVYQLCFWPTWQHRGASRLRFPENWFPFAYGAQDDPFTGKHDGVLRNGTGKVGDG